MTTSGTSMLIGAFKKQEPRKTTYTREAINSYKTSREKIQNYFEQQFGKSEKVKRAADVVNIKYNAMSPLVIGGALIADFITDPIETTKKVRKELKNAYNTMTIK